MSARGDRELLDAFAADLEPVRRAPSFGHQAAGVFGVALVCLGWVLAAVESPGALAAQIALRPSFGAVFAALLCAGVAGTLAGLAGAAPDRAHRSQLGVTAAACALGLGLLACLVALALTAEPAALGFEAHASCLARSVAIGLAPGAALLFFLLRGWVGRPRLAATAALVGALSFGSLAVHLACAALEPMHLVLGHLTAPVVFAGLASLPLAALLQRIAR
jgi:hypothetical protein